jgi:hypothetical protein
MNSGRQNHKQVTAPCQKRGGLGGRNFLAPNKLYPSLTDGAPKAPPERKARNR